MNQTTTLAGVSASLVLAAGCSVIKPMPMRLKSEPQVKVDEAWENMLDPPERLDRMLLLDTVLAMQLFHIGADRVYFIGEKKVGANLVTMEVFFNRVEPDSDRFAISIINGQGQRIRHEAYSRAEVDDRFAFLHGVVLKSAKPEAEVGESSEEDCEAEIAEREARRKARMEEIEAATQPASS